MISLLVGQALRFLTALLRRGVAESQREQEAGLVETVYYPESLAIRYLTASCFSLQILLGQQAAVRSRKKLSIHSHGMEPSSVSSARWIVLEVQLHELRIGVLAPNVSRSGLCTRPLLTARMTSNGIVGFLLSPTLWESRLSRRVS